MKRLYSRLFLGLVSLVTIISFQNCSKVSFQPSQLDAASESLGTVVPEEEIIEIPEPTPVPTPVPTPAPSPTPEVFNPADSGEFACKQYYTFGYEEGRHIEIPARNKETGICYVMKIMNSISARSSNNFEITDKDVISRNHDSRYDNSSLTRNPYIMGKAHISVNLKGKRTIKLSGAADDKTKITVDNFLLIGVAPLEMRGDARYYASYGSADSTVRETGGVIFKNEVVGLMPFTTGGTSTIAPLSLESSMQLNKDYELDVRALDCGASGGMSALYLIFQ